MKVKRQLVNTSEGRGNPAPSAKDYGPGSRLVGPLGTKFSTYDDILTNYGIGKTRIRT